MDAENSLFHALFYVDNVIHVPDSYVSGDDLPELEEVRDKIQELYFRIYDRQTDDKALQNRAVG